MRLDHHRMNVGPMERTLSAAGGLLLMMYGIRRRSPFSLAPIALGGALVYRGATGHSVIYEQLDIDRANGGPAGIEVRKAVTINRPSQEVYDFWRRLENLPRFMSHLESVEERGDGLSHWVARTPLIERQIEWDARIIEDRPGELLAWKTLPDSTIQHEGRVSFRPEGGPEGLRETIVHVAMTYRPPGGLPGEAFARLLNIVTAQQIKEEIRHFKAMMEAGEIPTIEGQPSGRKG